MPTSPASERKWQHVSPSTRSSASPSRSTSMGNAPPICGADIATRVPSESWFMCSVRVDDLDGLYEAIRVSGVPEASAGIPRLMPVREQPWGQRAGFLVDLDGTQLTLIQDRG